MKSTWHIVISAFTPMFLCFFTVICSRPCLNGGNCTAPNTCTCDEGWTGMQCEAGTVQRLAWVRDIVLLLQYTLVSVSSPAIDCGDPGTPTNGQHSLSRTTYSSVVTYTCDVGYTLQGPNSRTCQSDGQWSGSVPQCKSKLSQHLPWQVVYFDQCLKLAGQTFGFFSG